jgi:hypothetical protein
MRTVSLFVPDDIYNDPGRVVFRSGVFCRDIRRLLRPGLVGQALQTDLGRNGYFRLWIAFEF